MRCELPLCFEVNKFIHFLVQKAHSETQTSPPSSIGSVTHNQSLDGGEAENVIGFDMRCTKRHWQSERVYQTLGYYLDVQSLQHLNHWVKRTLSVIIR